MSTIIEFLKDVFGLTDEKAKKVVGSILLLMFFIVSAFLTLIPWCIGIYELYFKWLFN